MGEGDNINETRLIATGKERRTLIRVEGAGSMKEIPNTRVKITDDFVPVGTHSFRVSSTKGFKVGDRVIVYRPGTREWIHAIKMDQIVERKGTRQWTPQEYNLAFERQITKIEGQPSFYRQPCRDADGCQVWRRQKSISIRSTDVSGAVGMSAYLCS